VVESGQAQNIFDPIFTCHHLLVVQ